MMQDLDQIEIDNKTIINLFNRFKDDVFKNSLTIIAGDSIENLNETASFIYNEINSKGSFYMEDISRFEGDHFRQNLKRVFRVNPDIVHIGLLRTKKKSRNVLELIETGHKVMLIIHSDTIEDIKERIHTYFDEQTLSIFNSNNEILLQRKNEDKIVTSFEKISNI
ncbi:ATPase, T2SS/T4P/T4SS family [Vibrio parahaemolyticus]|uniref:ATPase, T2SS/T4P/T4SS family n=1 Tax=Vibrio parahaemolyticus TaxID=670 RepID=UPI003450E7AD